MNPIAFARNSGFVSSRKFSLSEIPQLTGRIAVITGGQAGIGEEIVAQLLLHGIAKVYVLARTEQKFVAAQKAWASRPGLSIEDVDARTGFVQCDLSDIKATADAAQALLKHLDRIDILFCNAGEMGSPLPVPIRCLTEPQLCHPKLPIRSQPTASIACSRPTPSATSS